MLYHSCYICPQDNLGTFTIPDVEEEVFYVSFLDGIQRVLLFTPALRIAEECQLAGDFETIDQDITISIHGVGISLVNNLNRAELLYMCIARYVQKYFSFLLNK